MHIDLSPTPSSGTSDPALDVEAPERRPGNRFGRSGRQGGDASRGYSDNLGVQCGSHRRKYPRVLRPDSLRVRLVAIASGRLAVLHTRQERRTVTRAWGDSRAASASRDIPSTGAPSFSTA